MSYQEEARAIDAQNNLKLIADKIIGELETLGNEPTKSWRRWVWELIQNAKDVKANEDGVSIEIILEDDRLTFRHDGKPFHVANIMGLIQQVSSKPSTSSDENTTGKFGTGFITTHLLSDVITVNGILVSEEEESRKFSLQLDRSAKSSEEMMPEIERLKNKVLNNLDDKALFPIYQGELVGLQTEFIYTLETEKTKNTAQTGIEDLKNTLPLTLAFVPEIKSVVIKDQTQNEELTFVCYPDQVEGVRKFIIKIQEQQIEKGERCYYVHDTPNLSLAVEYDHDDSKTIRMPNPDEPKLFRDFPLIGSNEFHLPVLLNGKSFYPTNGRDTILLNGNEEKVDHNVKILKQAFDAIPEFLEKLANLGVNGLYRFVVSQLPVVEFEEERESWWLEKLQEPYRDWLLEAEIVRTPNGTCKLKEAFFPMVEGEESLTLELYDLVAQLKGENSLPVKQELQNWIECLGLEHQEWEESLVYDIETLFEEINAFESIEGMIREGALQDEEAIWEWFKQLWAFIEHSDSSSLLKEYAIVPNIYGTFCKRDELFKEDDIGIPDVFLDVLLLLKANWYKEIQHREVNGLPVDHQSRGMSEITTEINSLVVQLENKDAEHELFLDVLISIHCISTPEAKEDGLQKELLKYASQIFTATREIKSDKRANKFNYEVAHKLLASEINKRIEEQENVDTLAELLDVDFETAIHWLDEYHRSLKKRALTKHLLEEGAIFPSRRGDFLQLDELQNYGTEAQPLDHDLLLILEDLNPDKNWLSELMADGIAIRSENTISFEQLGNEVINEVKRIRDDKLQEENREALLRLVEWVDNHPVLTRKYAFALSELNTEMFFKLTIKSPKSSKAVMSILKRPEQLEDIAQIVESGADLSQMRDLAELFPDGIPSEVMDVAKEESERKKEFSFMQRIGSKVEQFFKIALQEAGMDQFEVVYAGGGPYDFRITNHKSGNSFYIEVKSVRYHNEDDVKLAISQLKRAVKEMEKFALVIIERPANNDDLDEEYIRKNLGFMMNPGQYFKSALENYQLIEESANTEEEIHIKMENARFKLGVDYSFAKSKLIDFDNLIKEAVRQIS